MCYNIYIMRKFCFFIIFTALFLCGCEKEQPPEYVFHEDFPLTAMTTVTTVPADTYSEYMATYTPSDTTGTDVYYYHLPQLSGAAADTGMGSLTVPGAPQNAIPPMDTAVTVSVPAETAVPSSENTSSEFTETATVYSLERPPADTAFYPEVSAISADTAPTEFIPSETETETSNEE